MGMGEAMRGEKYFHCNHGGRFHEGFLLIPVSAIMKALLCIYFLEER